jgi:hypothetical protein
MMILSLNVFAADPDPYVEALQEKRFLKLTNGNEILISYHSPSEETNAKIRIFMRKNDKILWDKTFVDEFDELWNQANFIPVIKDKFFEDLNDDGFYEIGIANWNGGKAPCASSAIIFTVKDDSLQFLKKQQINTEFSRFIYQRKNDFKNSKYKDSLCKKLTLKVR